MAQVEILWDNIKQEIVNWLIAIGNQIKKKAFALPHAFLNVGTVIFMIDVIKMISASLIVTIKRNYQFYFQISKTVIPALCRNLSKARFKT